MAKSDNDKSSVTTVTAATGWETGKFGFHCRGADHPASHPQNTHGYFPGIKTAGA
jgi:hypothetical protein